MTSKDFLYLGLIVVSALVCYCHGFFSGVNRARKVYEALLGDGRTGEPAPPEPDVDDSGGRHQTPDGLGHLPRWRTRSFGQDMHGDFGNN